MTVMTDKEYMYKAMTEKGFEVSRIGCTLQWTVPNGRTIIKFFDEQENLVKTEVIV